MRISEVFKAYFQDEVSLGIILCLTERDLISYSLRGLILQIQAKMTRFKDLATFLKVMNELTMEERQVNPLRIFQQLARFTVESA